MAPRKKRGMQSLTSIRVKRVVRFLKECSFLSALVITVYINGHIEEKLYPF